MGSIPSSAAPFLPGTRRIPAHTTHREPKGPDMIGLSLSLCVADIIAGRVRVEDVEVIHSTTRAEDGAGWERVVRAYAGKWWKQDPERACRVAMLLYDAGRIRQPLLTGHRHPGIPEGHWVGQPRTMMHVAKIYRRDRRFRVGEHLYGTDIYRTADRMEAWSMAEALWDGPRFRFVLECVPDPSTASAVGRAGGHGNATGGTPA